MEVRLMNEFHGRNFPKQLVSGSFRVPIRYTSFDIVTPLVVAAVPPELRRKMGLKPRTEDDSSDVYKAGAGVLAPAGSARDGKFLKKKSGVPASVRTSGLAQNRSPGAKAVISRPKIGGEHVLAAPTGNTKSAARGSKTSRDAVRRGVRPKATRSSVTNSARTPRALTHDDRYDEVL